MCREHGYGTYCRGYKGVKEQGETGTEEQGGTETGDRNHLILCSQAQKRWLPNDLSLVWLIMLCHLSVHWYVAHLN